MSIPSPLLFRRQTLELLAEIEKTLAVKPPDGGLGWQAQKGGPGQGMVELFGRFLDIIVARLNKAPQQHFLAFSARAGSTSCRPSRPRPSSSSRREGRAPAIPVPAGTQVATRASGDQEEIVFETEHDIQVIPTELVRCFATDQRTFADHTSRANGDEPGSFAGSGGERCASASCTCATICFSPSPTTRPRAFDRHAGLRADPAPPAGPAGAWQLEWFYYRLLDKQDLEKNWLPLTGHPPRR